MQTLPPPYRTMHVGFFWYLAVVCTRLRCSGLLGALCSLGIMVQHSPGSGIRAVSCLQLVETSTESSLLPVTHWLQFSLSSWRLKQQHEGCSSFFPFLSPRHAHLQLQRMGLYPWLLDAWLGKGSPAVSAAGCSVQSHFLHAGQRLHLRLFPLKSQTVQTCHSNSDCLE